MKKLQIMLIVAMALVIFGCSNDNSTSPTATVLNDVRADPGIDIVAGTPNDNPSIDPKDIQLSAVGLDALFGPDKLPPCLVFEDGSFVWNLNISGGVYTGTALRYDGQIWDVNGSGRTLNCTIADHVNYCDFTYYVEVVDMAAHSASGTWQNTTCAGTGTWSGVGSRCP